MRASDSSIGDAAASTARQSTSSRRRPSGTNVHYHQRSDSSLLSHPGLSSRHPLHQRHRTIRPPKTSAKSGAQTEASSPSEKVTPASHPNPGPVQGEYNNSGRLKRLFGRCKIASIEAPSFPLSFSIVCPFSCISTNDMST